MYGPFTGWSNPPPLPPVGGTGSYPLVGVVSLGSCLAFPFFLFPLLRPGAFVEVRKQRVRSVGSALPAHSVLLSFSFFERLRQADKYCFSARCPAWDLRHRKARYSPCSTSRLEPCLILSATASDQPVGMHCFSSWTKRDGLLHHLISCVCSLGPCLVAFTTNAVHLHVLLFGKDGRLAPSHPSQSARFNIFKAR